MKFLDEYFARRIVQRRRELDISRAELARRTGLSNPGITLVEQGRNIPSIDTFARLCEVLDLFPSVFFDRFKSVINPKAAPEPVRRKEELEDGKED